MVSARGLALRALVALHKGRSERLRSELDGRGLDGRDLAFAYELSHGVVRRERLLDAVLLGFAHRGLPKDPTLLAALRLGVHQLLFVPGMPAHAAVHETVGLVRNNRGFANALLRKIAGAVQDRAADPQQPRTELALGEARSFALPRPLPEDEVERLAVLHSLPDWLAARCCEQHGVAGLREVAAAASTTPGIYLRAGRDVDAATLRAELAEHDVEVAPTDHARLLRWVGGATPFGTPAFAAGRFVVQDPTALAAVEAVPCRAGDTVVDLCAAPGTKTTFLAERVGADGRVFAFDPDARRRERIVENVERLQLADVVEVVADGDKLPVADCVLADVPCSNTGVLGRRVEVRRRLAPGTFEELPRLQRQLLDRAIALARPGGHVIYSTCSIDREENEAVVTAARSEHGALELVASQLTLPRAGVHDGGYFAVLRRPGA
ncbi:MAG: hypothetical protein KAI24_18885 [Planctomycetes bacterium]|nr:hypothetical protein [Planctomycetota bacterium]